MREGPFPIIQRSRENNKKKFGFLTAMILALLFIIAGQIVVMPILIPLVLTLFKSSSSVYRELYASLEILLTSLGTISLLYLWIRFVEKRQFRELGFMKKDAFKKYLRGFLMGLILLSVPVAFLIFTGSAVFHVQPVSSLMLFSMGATLVGFLAQGASEEILIRGWLFQTLSARFRIWFSLPASALLFGALHLPNRGITVLSFSIIVMYGIFAGLYVLFENDLWGICGFHSCWNWAQLSIYGFAVSGIITESHPLLLPVLRGPDFLNGGIFGIEGSLFTLIMLILVSLIIWRLIRNRLRAVE